MISVCGNLFSYFSCMDESMAEQMDATVGLFTGGIFLFQIVIYLVYSYFQYKLSKKLDVKYSWMAWIPVLGIFNLTKIAGLSYWWILGLFVPLWNIYAIIKIMHGISKNTWHGAGWTVGLIFLYFIFFPITAITYVPVIKNPDAPLAQE